MNDSNKLENKDLGVLILRITIGGLMLFHGVTKLIHGHHAVKGMLISKGLPAFLWLMVPLTEVLAPVLLIFGLFTRFSAFGIALMMLASLFVAFGWSAFSIGIHGGLTAELNLLFLGAACTLVFTGAGKYSIYQPKKHR